jgi:Zn-dependent peptidase ImmA (M78 family)/DNA-binding XRE family transcriptional regulator
MPQVSSRDLRGARLLTLRQIEGLTQEALAKQLHVTQGFISHIEKGLKPLSVEIATAAAVAYELPIEFFTAPPSLTDEGFATFRKSSKATVHDENKVTASFGEAARLFRIVSEESGYRTADFNDARDLDEEVTARNVRRMLGIADDEPLLNATRAVERLGVGVIHDLVSLPAASRDHAGVARPNPFVDRPLVATLGTLPPAVARLTVLHELAHIIYDRDRMTPIRGTRSLEEKRAFKFAAAVLLPANVVRKRVTDSLTLHGFLPIKADYGISVAAIIVRAADLGVISAERKRTLMIQMSSNGWRRDEPVQVAEEHPILVNQATTRSIGNTARTVATTVGISYANAIRWTGLPLDAPRDGLADVIELRPRVKREPRAGKSSHRS